MKLACIGLSDDSRWRIDKKSTSSIELGLSDEQIKELYEKKVITQRDFQTAMKTK